MSYTVSELKILCKEKNIKGYSTKKKDELLQLLGLTSQSNNIDNLITSFEKHTLEESNHDLLDLLQKLLEKNTIKVISEKLNLSSGTLLRWIELKDIPQSYEFDLLKLSNIKIDYSKYSSKQKDQFFTPVDTAKKCFDIFCKELKKVNENEDDFHYIEPSAGEGSFLKVLPKNKTIGLDIDPKSENIQQKDYLEWKPSESNLLSESKLPFDLKYVVFGNPPFGLRGHLALRFINHSFEFADYVCFILPQLFESDGKGVPRKRVKGYNLLYSGKIDSNFYEPDKTEIKINTIFQIWSKNHKNKDFDIKEYKSETMKIFSMSDGGTVSTTRNKDMIGKCDIYIPSTCFGKENMKCYSCFEDLPGRKGYGILFIHDKQDMINKVLKIKWDEVAFLSTNSAYNLRSSQIYSLFDI
jgi:hypothetical protein